MPSVTLQPPLRDNVLKQADPSTNLGTLALLNVVPNIHSPSNLMRSVLVFRPSDYPQIPKVAGKITAATLSWYYFQKYNPSYDPVGRTEWAYKLTKKEWREYESTWNVPGASSQWVSITGEQGVWCCIFANGYIYAGITMNFGGNGGVVKLDPITMERIANHAGDSISSLMYFGGYIYAADKYANPGQVWKMNPSDLSVVGTWTAPAGISVMLQLANDGTYIYVTNESGSLGIDLSPASIFKIDPSAMTTVGSPWTGTASQRGGAGLIYKDGFLFVSCHGENPGKVVKVNASTMTTDSVLTCDAGDYQAQKFCSDGTYLYLTFRTIDPDPGRAVKIDPTTSPPTIVATWNDATPHNYAHAPTFYGGYLYIASEDVPGELIKVNPSTMTTVSVWVGAGGSNQGQSWEAAFDNGGYANVGLCNGNGGVGSIIKVNPATMTTVSLANTWPDAGGDWVTSSPAGGSCVVPASFGWMAFNVLAIVQDAITNNIDVNIIVKDGDETAQYDYGTYIHSKEYTTDTSLRPKLDITYDESINYKDINTLFKLQAGVTTYKDIDTLFKLQVGVTNYKDANTLFKLISPTTKFKDIPTLFRLRKSTSCEDLVAIADGSLLQLWHPWWPHTFPNHYQAVRLPSDGDIVEGENWGTADLYVFNKTTRRTDGIRKIIIAFLGGRSNPLAYFRIIFKLGGPIYEAPASPAHLYLNPYYGYYICYNSPATGLPWTIAELDNMEAGVRMWDSGIPSGEWLDSYFIKVTWADAAVQTLAATGYIGTEVDLNGSVLEDECWPTCTVYFQWGLTAAYGSVTANQSKSKGDSFTAHLTGIDPSKIYHYRAVIRTPAGETFYGGDKTFPTIYAAQGTIPHRLIAEDLI